MLRTLTSVVLFMLTLCLPLSALAASKSTGASTHASTHESAAQQADSARVAAMNRMVKAALEQSLKVMIKEKKPIFPFALLQHKNGRVDSMTYQPQKNKDGSFKPQPDAERWSAELFVRLREMAKTQPDLEIALLTRMDTVKNKQGKDVLGIWTEVDHRHERPWVVFMPLLKQKDGSLKQGDLIYYATDQAIFTHPAAKPKKTAK